ncbi:MAG TPA: YkgJ family cysteine cluster protein [Candidatus Thermoplasmatota archaeon]|nr:YkgJ family cysteine cluster protein [Candidatus Thermoplasmatota archaeon]
MPETSPANASTSPCFKHGCAECCYETEMPLQNADIQRLEKAGHAREKFANVNEEHGFALLKNTEPTDGSRPHCVFLVESKCSVYEHRPDGCRYYPIVYQPAKRGPVRDTECPHNTEFNVTAAHFKTLPLIIKQLTKEARHRREAAEAAKSEKA